MMGAAGVSMAGHRAGGAGTAGTAGIAANPAGQGGAGQAGASPVDAGTGGPVEGTPLSDATRAWWAYDRPAAFDVAKSDIMVPLRDGVMLTCSLSRPAKGAEPMPGKFPGLVVEYTPYALIIDIMIAEAGFFAKHGYNALVCQVRGTGTSGGTWNNAGARQDGVDAYDLIEWLATQPFSDGRMGQFGGSYGGFTSYQAAAEQPPHLLATAPMIAPGSLYHDVIYPGGIPLPLKPMFISEEGPRGVGGKGWRELTWNPTTNSTPSYQLGSDNTLAPMATATAAVTFKEPAEPKDAGGSATFTTAPLSADHVLVGHPALHLRATLSAADANFYVELIDVNAKGEETLVNDGFLKASHRKSDTTPEAVTAGTAIDYVIAIRADHHRFVAGNSLRIRISGGDSMSLVPAERVDIMLQTGEASTLHMPPGW
jgi:predicted acyl esterase